MNIILRNYPLNDIYTSSSYWISTLLYHCVVYGETKIYDHIELMLIFIIIIIEILIQRYKRLIIDDRNKLINTIVKLSEIGLFNISVILLCMLVTLSKQW